MPRSGTTQMPNGLVLRPADPGDLDAAVALLAANGMPVDDVAQHFHAFVVVAQLNGGGIVATAGLEHCGDAALLRSLCVASGFRGRGLGQALVSALLARARGERADHGCGGVL